MPNAPLSEEVYAEAMGAMVVVCTDVVCINRHHRTVLLAHRRVKPMPGLWVVGGRVRAGESFKEAAVRKLADEIKIVVAKSRLGFVREDRFIWSERQQEPQNVGSDNICHVFHLELTTRELELVRLDPSEYADTQLREYSRQALVAAGVHERILDLYDEIFPSRRQILRSMGRSIALGLARLLSV